MATEARKRRPRGTGSIFRNGERFRAQYISPQNGQKFSETFDTEREAENYLREVIAATYGGAAPVPEGMRDLKKMKVADFFAAWLAHKYSEHTPLTPQHANTLAAYERMVKLWILPPMGSMFVLQLHEDNVKQWLQWLTTARSQKTKRTLGIHQQRYAWTIFKQAMSWGVKKGYLPTSPVGSIKGIASPNDKPKDRAMTKKDSKAFRTLLKAKGCKHESGYCELRWELALVLAKRQSEVLALKWSSVSLGRKAPYIELREHLVVRKWTHGCPGGNTCGRSYAGHCPQRHGGGRMIIPGTKTGDQNHPRFPLTKELVRLFRRHKKAVDAERKKALEDGTVDVRHIKEMNYEGLVFCHPRLLTPLTPSKDYARFKELCVEAELSREHRLHDLRHTAVTYLVEASGGNTGLAMVIANHRSSLTTQKYSHPDMAASLKALGDVSRMLADADAE